MNRYSYDEGTPDSPNFREPDDLFHESDSDALDESTDRASSFSSLGIVKVEPYRGFPIRESEHVHQQTF